MMIKFFTKHRLLDGYIGILSLVLWYRVLAGYSSWFYIFHLSLKYVFSVSLVHHPKPSQYPPLQFSIELFSFCLFDNGKKAAEEISKNVDRYMKERAVEKEAARKRIQDIDPEAARFI